MAKCEADSKTTLRLLMDSGLKLEFSSADGSFLHNLYYYFNREFIPGIRQVCLFPVSVSDEID